MRKLRLLFGFAWLALLTALVAIRAKFTRKPAMLPVDAEAEARIERLIKQVKVDHYYMSRGKDVP